MIFQPNPFIIVLLMATFFTSCSKQRPFNSDEWKAVSGEELIKGVFDGKTKRELMAEDLIDNGLLNGKHYQKVQDLLGQQQMYDQIVEYELVERYRWNIDPEEVVYLKVRFDRDSLVQEVDIDGYR